MELDQKLARDEGKIKAHVFERSSHCKQLARGGLGSASRHAEPRVLRGNGLCAKPRDPLAVELGARDAGNENWNDPKPSNWWFPVREFVSSFNHIPFSPRSKSGFCRADRLAQELPGSLRQPQGAAYGGEDSSGGAAGLDVDPNPRLQVTKGVSLCLVDSSLLEEKNTIPVLNWVDEHGGPQTFASCLKCCPFLLTSPSFPLSSSFPPSLSPSLAAFVASLFPSSPSYLPSFLPTVCCDSVFLCFCCFVSSQCFCASASQSL